MESFNNINWLTSGKHVPRHAYLASELAEAGFFYLNEGCKTRCFSCHNEFDWSENANEYPMDVHQKHAPFCEFVLGKDKTNLKAYEEAHQNKLAQEAVEKLSSLMKNKHILRFVETLQEVVLDGYGKEYKKGDI